MVSPHGSGAAGNSEWTPFKREAHENRDFPSILLGAVSGPTAVFLVCHTPYSSWITWPQICMGLSLLPIPVLLTWSMSPRLSITRVTSSPVGSCSGEACSCSWGHSGSHLGHAGFSPGLWHCHNLWTCARPNYFLSISSAPTWVPCSPETMPEGWNNHRTKL